MELTILQAALQKADTLADAQAAQLTLEDVGVLKLYARAKEASGVLPAQEAHRCRRIRELIDAWARLPVARSDENGQPQQNRRTQNTLREALQKLCQRDYASVSETEVLFLQATHAALEAKADPDAAAIRLRDLILRELHAYEAYAAMAQARVPDGVAEAQPEPAIAAAASVEETPPAPALDQAFQAMPLPNPDRLPGDEDDGYEYNGLVLNSGGCGDKNAPPTVLEAAGLFSHVPKQKVALLDGVEANLTVGVYEVEGNTVIKGDVPEDVLLVVKNGSVVIDGFVEGNLMAGGDISINGNVAGGSVISNGGNVVAQAILSRSKLVSKRGQIRVERTENPACLFSFGALHVHGDVLGGKYLGASITVDGNATSAELHSTGPIRAKAICVAPHTHSIVCLRKTLSSADYGAPPPAQMRKLYRSLGKFTHDAGVLERFVRFASRDIRDSQRTLLLYLTGGTNNPQEARSVRGLQYQSRALTEYAEVAENLRVLFQEATDADIRITGPEVRVICDQCIENLNHLASEMGTAVTTYDLTYKNEAYRAGKFVSAIAVRLARDQIQKEEYPRIAEELQRQSESWQELSKQSVNEGRKRLRAWGLTEEAVARFESKPGEVTESLDETYAQIKQNPRSPQGQRAASSVARLLRSAIDRNEKNIANWRKLLHTTQGELRSVRQFLTASFAYLFTNEAEGGASVHAGSYALGTVFAANPAMGGDPLSTAQSVVYLKEPLRTPSVFRLRNNSIVRESAAQ